MKRELKYRHYGRYVDDFYIVGVDKARLLSSINVIDAFLRKTLFLRLHPRKRILQRQECGVPFVGGILKSRKRYLAPRSRKLMAETIAWRFRCEEDPFLLQAVIQSYEGYTAHFQRTT